MTLVLTPLGVGTLSGLPFRGQAPVGAYERNLSGPPVRWSSYPSGLKRGTPVTPVGVESPVGDSIALGRRPQNRAANKGYRPKNRHSQNGKVKLFPADRGHHGPAPKGGMSGWLCLVSVSLLCLLVALVGRFWSAVAPGCFPGRLLFLRECFFVTFEADRSADSINEHSCQVRPGNYCSGGYWAVVVHYCCGSGRVDMAVCEMVEQGSCNFRFSRMCSLRSTPVLMH